MNTFYGHIYKLTNNITHKSYIGQAKCINQRKNTYKHLRCKTQPKLYNALVKYGFDNFTFEIIDHSISPEHANELEIKYIREFNTIENGYNIESGGHNLMSEATKRKISESLRGRIKSEEHRRKLSEALRGVPKSEEHKHNLAKSVTGFHHTEETKRKISERNIGMRGKRHTVESKEKMRLSQLGKRHSDETKHQMSISHLRKSTNIPNSRSNTFSKCS
jgi:group I intron endonuclease